MSDGQGLYGRMLDASPGPVAMADGAGLLTYVNQAFVELVGHASREEVIGRSAVTFWDPPALAAEAFESLLRDGHWSGQVSVRRPDGTRRTVEASGAVLTRVRSPRSAIRSRTVRIEPSAR